MHRALHVYRGALLYFPKAFKNSDVDNERFKRGSGFPLS